MDSKMIVMNKTLYKPIIIILAIGILYLGLNFEDLFVKPKYRAAIISVMIDPTSVLFRNEHFNGYFMCGEYNAKNRMGAYIGFKQFISDTDNARVVDAVHTLNGGNNIMFKIRSIASLNDKLKTDYENLRKLKSDLPIAYTDEYEQEKAKEDLDNLEFEMYWTSICLKE